MRKKEIELKKKISEIKEMFEKSAEEMRNIPNIKQKHKEVVLARGHVLELSTHIEQSFKALLLTMGDGKIPYSFMSKAKVAEELMLKDDSIEREDFRTFQDFVVLRNIFAHCPITDYSKKLEFDTTSYPGFFENHSEWKDFDIAINHFCAIIGSTLELIQSFTKRYKLQKLMKLEMWEAVWGVEMSEEMIDKITKEGEKMMEEMEAERLARRGPRAEGD